MMRNRPLLLCRPKCASRTMKIAVLICFLASNNIAGQWNHAAQAFQQPSRRTSCSSLPLQRPRYRQMISHLTSRGSSNFACIGIARKFATNNLRLHAEATSSSSSVTSSDTSTSTSAGSFDEFDYMAVSTCTLNQIEFCWETDLPYHASIVCNDATLIFAWCFSHITNTCPGAFLLSCHKNIPTFHFNISTGIPLPLPAMFRTTNQPKSRCLTWTMLYHDRPTFPRTGKNRQSESRAVWPTTRNRSMP